MLPMNTRWLLRFNMTILFIFHIFLLCLSFLPQKNGKLLTTSLILKLIVFLFKKCCSSMFDIELSSRVFTWVQECIAKWEPLSHDPIDFFKFISDKVKVNLWKNQRYECLHRYLNNIGTKMIRDYTDCQRDQIKLFLMYLYFVPYFWVSRVFCHRSYLNSYYLKHK